MYFIDNNTGWVLGLLGLIFKTTNSGNTWSTLSSGTNLTLTNLFFADANTGWVCGDNLSVRKTTNGGVNWSNQYLAGMYFFNGIHFINSMTGWVVGENGSILKTITGGVGIRKIESGIPDKFLLLQNYPNPFNPSTNIRYQIPDNKFVNLKVFDAIGKEIETLVNEKQSPGTYEVIFDGSIYSSGIYFYKLITDGFSETKKMVLIK